MGCGKPCGVQERRVKNKKFTRRNLTLRRQLVIVIRFREIREPVAVQVARGRLVCRVGRSRCDTLERSWPRGLCKESGMGRLRCGAVSSQSYLRHPPPRMGYAGRNRRNGAYSNFQECWSAGLDVGSQSGRRIQGKQGTLGHRRLLFV